MRKGFWTTYRLGAAVTFVLTGAVGFLPLFGGPGYEHAVATGLLVPSVAAITTSVATARDPGGALTRVGRGVVTGLAYAGIALLTALAHALRVGVCEIFGALPYFALTAGMGCVMGGAWGAFAGGVVKAASPKRLRSWAALVALAGPFASVVVSLLRYWSSPMIFAFDPFVGYFSGSLYDTLIEPGMSLLTYRLGSLATLTAFACFAASTDERYPRAGLRIVGAITALASLSITFAGTKLNHFHTTDSIVKDLGAEKHGARCDVVYPSTTREQEALLLVKDCDEDVAAVEKALGAPFPHRVRAFFFRDADDKRRLMGAAGVYIAKPWRREVYLQLNGYPHPVLAHELAHVLAGDFGRGPFKIGGEWGGWLPNPGLVEGIAVFAAPDDEDLTDLQWARAMKQIGILPPMQRVFSLGFLGDASAKSYTLAGAFVSWIAETYGTETVRAWYGGGDITALTKKDWPALDREFAAHVERVALPDEAASFAKAKFSRPGIFGRKCPHLVDALRKEADVCRDSQRFDEAIGTYRKVLAKDPDDWASQKDIAVIQRRHRDKAAGRAALERFVADEKRVPRTFRDRADEALGDADFVDGEYEAAAVRYERLAARSLDEDAARTFEIKALAARDPAARPAVQALLLGDAKHGADIFLGGVRLGDWRARGTPDALVSYLVGRNLVTRGFYEAGATYLDEALAAPATNARVARETIRQRAIAACALGDAPTLAKMRDRIEHPADASADPFRGAVGGRRQATLRLIARCSAH